MAIKAPDRKPYNMAKRRIVTRDFAKIQNTSADNPRRNAHGTIMLNRPMKSESSGGARRPTMPPPFMAERT